MKKTFIYILLSLITLSIIIFLQGFLFSASFEPIEFKKVEVTIIFNLLTTLWFIAWLVESFLEIIIKIFQVESKAESSDIASGTAIAGFIIGLIIAVSGIRTLDIFFGIENYSDLQKLVFGSVDTILTASVIAGGSKGIHELTNAYKRIIQFIQGQTNSVPQDRAAKNESIDLKSIS